MNKIFFPLVLLFFAIHSKAQVQFSLSLLADQETYIVSLLPEKDIPAPLNMTSNIQVVIKVPLDQPFLAGQLVSQVEGIDWIDNAYANQASEGELYALCAFTMVQSTTKNIEFVASKETPLFTFKNLQSGCIGAITLPENRDVTVNKAVARGFNFTQNITLLASRGNGYTGVVNKIAACPSLSTSTEDLTISADLKAYPVPTNQQLTIEWTNLKNVEKLELDLMNTAGQLLQTIELDPRQGAKKRQLEVGQYATGLYHFFLKNSEGEQQQHKFIIANQR